MKNARLEEAQAGIKIAGRRINNLRYADDTTLMAESEEELKSLMKVKEENEKVGFTGLPVHHHLLEFTRARVHWVSGAIQPSRPLSSPFPPAPSSSQHRGLFR